MGNRNLFGHIEDALGKVGGAISSKPAQSILTAISRLDPEIAAAQDARKFAREQQRETQRFQLKRDELLGQARESLAKKKAKAQADKEEQERQQKFVEEQDAKEDEQFGINSIIERFAESREAAGDQFVPGEISPEDRAFALKASQQGGFDPIDAIRQAEFLAGPGEEATKPTALAEKSALIDEIASTLGLTPQEVAQAKFRLSGGAPKAGPLPTAISELKRLRDLGPENGGITNEQYIESLLKKGTASTIDLQKSTLGDIEKEIIDKTISLASMEVVKELFRPEFLTYVGKTKQFILKQADKLGILNRNQYLRQFASWNSTQSLLSLFIRKEITGVAGGEKEMELIMGKLPDADKDTPQVYEAKVERQEQIYLLTIDLLNEFRNSTGFAPSKTQKKELVSRAWKQVTRDSLVLPPQIQDEPATRSERRDIDKLVPEEQNAKTR